MDFKNPKSNFSSKKTDVATTGRDSVKQQKQAQESEDPVFIKYGPPFLVNDADNIVLNERAVAIKCATQHQVRYDTKAKRYERYDSERGLWVSAHEVEVHRLLDNLLVELGRELD